MKLNLINIMIDSDDAPEFIAEIKPILNGVLRSAAPEDFILIKIDGWFGPNWLAFSGKVLGLLGVWNKPLRVPPFVPNRVISQHVFSGPDYEVESLRVPLHRKMTGGFAVQRHMAREAGGSFLAWYSSDSLKNGRGSLMVYMPGEEYWFWYAGWERNRRWDIVQTKEIGTQQLARFKNLGLAVLDNRGAAAGDVSPVASRLKLM
jgi:hypothetical protein